MYNGILVVEYNVEMDVEHHLTTELSDSSKTQTLYDIISFSEKHPSLEFPLGKCCQDTFFAAGHLGPHKSSSEYWYAEWVQQRLNEDGIECLSEVQPRFAACSG